MATDYSKKTNAELVDILKTRSLPHTGKKADMVSRLQQDDESKSSDAPAAAPVAAKTDAPEDVIDWDDEPAETTAAPSTEAGAAAIAAGGKGTVPNPVAVPNQQLGEDPAVTDDLKVESTGAAPETNTQPEAATEQKPAVDYTRGLPQTDLEAELAKRKARAQKFGIVEDDDTALKEATKQLERAKRFGAGAEAGAAPSLGVSRLDQALTDERPNKRRNDSRNDQGGRGGKKRDTGRNRNRQRGDANRNRGDGGNNKTNAGVKKPNATASSAPRSWSDKDQAAMEARKKRFAAAA
ncbi:DNA-binding SAP [Penicillium sp. IBT 31633x]|nr:DNA-binding SAP [Penicillium sp. IBT 31633x]